MKYFLLCLWTIGVVCLFLMIFLAVFSFGAISVTEGNTECKVVGPHWICGRVK